MKYSSLTIILNKIRYSQHIYDETIKVYAFIKNTQNLVICPLTFQLDSTVILHEFFIIMQLTVLITEQKNTPS